MKFGLLFLNINAYISLTICPRDKWQIGEQKRKLNGRENYQEYSINNPFTFEDA